MSKTAVQVTVGDIYGRWTVIGDRDPMQRLPHVLCRCECGKEKSVRPVYLRSGHTRSCGCLRADIMRASKAAHGHARDDRGRTPTYRSWLSMRARCGNPKDKNWKDYGARGIAVCERWQSFENFLADMGTRSEGKTIDRYPDGDGNYEPGNCRWATATEQARNKIGNKLNAMMASEIRAANDAGEAKKSIAMRMGIDPRTVDDVVRNKTWKVAP